MKFYIFLFAIIVAAMAAANPEPEAKPEPEPEAKPEPSPDMEWLAEYGKIGYRFPLRAAYPYYRLAEPRRYRISYPYALKTEYDPEYFYEKFGYYP